MTNLPLKHSHLVVERQVVRLSRRPDNNTPEPAFYHAGATEAMNVQILRLANGLPTTV